MLSSHEGVKYPCTKCEFQASSQSSLYVHVKKIHGLVEYALSHDDFLSNISLNVVHYIQIPRGPRGINFFRIAKIKLHQKKEEVTTVQKIYRCHTKVNLNLS